MKYLRTMYKYGYIAICVKLLVNRHHKYLNAGGAYTDVPTKLLGVGNAYN